MCRKKGSEIAECLLENNSEFLSHHGRAACCKYSCLQAICLLDASLNFKHVADTEALV